MKVNNLRAFLFTWLDYINGNHVNSHYNKLNYYINNATYQEIKSFQLKSLKELLHHAHKTCGYYQEIKEENLSSFPVVNKKIITDNRSSFLSDKFQKERLHKVATSGSTGTPFAVYQDARKTKYHQADTIFFNELSNFRLGEKLFYLRVWEKIVKKSKMTGLLQNLVPIDASNLDCESLKEDFFKRIKSNTGKISVLAYASTFEAISKCLPEGGERVTNVNSLITMSETLPDGSKDKLEEFFNCDVISRYSNMENGMIGIQIKDVNYYYLINEVSFVIEILKLESDEPVEEGQMGRIVITDLFNFSQPMIRYDTGDIGSTCYKEYKGQKRFFFRRVEGRKVDFITDTSGLLLSPHTITNTMWKYQFVVQFQFIQLDKQSYKLILNLEDKFKKNVGDIINDLKKHVGANAIITTEYTNEIPLLNSGKRKKIVNLWQN